MVVGNSEGSGDFSFTSSVVGGKLHLIKKKHSPSISRRLQISHIGKLGNIAGASPRFRERVLHTFNANCRFVVAPDLDSLGHNVWR